jgi:hypothetical protein
MAKDPWTDPDPQPGDFDTELDQPRSGQIEIHAGNPGANLSILVSVEGDDARRLEQIASERGQQPGEVVSELLRSAEGLPKASLSPEIASILQRPAELHRCGSNRTAPREQCSGISAPSRPRCLVSGLCRE